MKALQGYFPPRFEWACPQCGYQDFVEVLEFFKATAGGKGLRCVNCRVAYEVKIELLDPRSPTLRAAVQSEQGGAELCLKCGQPAYHHDPSCFVHAKSPHPNRSDGS